MKRHYYGALVYLAKKLELALYEGSRLLQRKWLSLGYLRDAWWRKANPHLSPSRTE